MIDEDKINEIERNFIDKMVEDARLNDNDAYEKFQWLDKIAQKEGISFYTKVCLVLNKFDVEEKAKQWITEKDN